LSCALAISAASMLVDCQGLFGPISQDQLLSELANGGKNLDPDQVRRILMKAIPATRIGRMSVDDLLRMDEIAIKYCNKKELDYRNDTCRKSVAGENVRKFCEHGFGRLVEFCDENLDKVFRANLVLIGSPARQELDFFKRGVERNVDGQQDKDVKAAISVFMTENSHASQSYFEQVGPKCEVVTEHLESIEAILTYSGDERLDRRLNDSLVNMYRLYKICKVFINDFASQ
jgi:hypothetical protein